MKRINFIFMIGVIFISCSVKYNEFNPKLLSDGKTIEDFIPKGWKLIGKASGLLNKDKLADIVGIIEYAKKSNYEGQNTDDDFGPPRILFIALKNDDKYKLIVQTDNAILKSQEGGIFGDPFSGISIRKNSLFIYFYGGSAWRWSYSFQFRYQDKGLYLIGVASTYYHNGTHEGESKEYNLLTGIMHLKETDQNEKESFKKIDRGKRSLLNLKDFTTEKLEDEQF